MNKLLDRIDDVIIWAIVNFKRMCMIGLYLFVAIMIVPLCIAGIFMLPIKFPLNYFISAGIYIVHSFLIKGWLLYTNREDLSKARYPWFACMTLSTIISAIVIIIAEVYVYEKTNGCF